MHVNAEGPQFRLHKGVTTNGHDGKWVQPFPRTRGRLAPHGDILRLEGRIWQLQGGGFVREAALRTAERPGIRARSGERR
jgi:hypothetical protein